MIRKGAIISLILFVLIQFIPYRQPTPKVVSDQDFLSTATGSSSAKSLFKNACYDCHSYEGKSYWYNHIAPISWWTYHHVKEAQEHVNYSTLMALPSDKIAKALEESKEEVELKKMPLKSYALMHKEARINDSQQIELVNFLDTQIQQVQSR